MKKYSFLSFFILLTYATTAWAQATFPYNGIKDQREGWYAITHATLIPRAGEEIQDATLVIKSGRIVSIQKGGSVPVGALEIDAAGKYIYPSLIDVYAEYGLPKVKPAGERARMQPQMLSNKSGAYAWNEALKPEFRAHAVFDADEKAAEGWRNMGFGLLATHQQDGISRGTAAVVSLGSGRAHELIIKKEAAHYLSFRKGVSTQSYPSSQMGVMALLRQTYLDADWYKRANTEKNFSLEAWNEVMGMPQIFEVEDWQEALRADKVGDEFGHQYIFKGSGDEYQRLDALKNTGATFIIPLKFPDTYDVSDPYDAHQLSLAQLRHWELAPANAARVAEEGIPFVLTADGHGKPADFMAALRKAIENGLSENDALRALTETPAQLLGISAEAGTLEKGKWANFLVTSAPLFSSSAKIHHNWIQGKPHTLNPIPVYDLKGDYALVAGSRTYNLTISEKGGKITIDSSTSLDVKFTESGGLVSLSFPADKDADLVRLTGVVGEDEWFGRGQDAAGEWITWRAKKVSDAPSAKEAPKPAATEPAAFAGQVTYPFGAYGWQSAPTAQTVLIRNATLWTNEAAGIIPRGDILLINGKIAQVGGVIRGPRGAVEVDGTGMHVTPGIIDEHSHIALSSVNEGSQESTAEVRMEDVIDANDINIYRQLSGGVTTSQLLHGSANPIGGQSAIIKLRWGFVADAMRFAGAPGFIKFALGENVKQSNWGDNNRIRYPQTRMGVEQVYENYFTEAREYGKALKSGQLVRRDLDLETLLEILEGKRFITCHSYQQGEINMLMKVAERFGFRVNTFTHILEGYKVADKMAQHGAGGSSFSDWWAYKFEVIEAIPYNGAIMHEQGVTVAFNSDDAEMARRLNQEAAKAVLFGGVSEEDAFKFVTLNPAKLLHIDDKVGSLKVGKDADIVLWTDHPLSVYARAKQTYIDGIKFYDMDADVDMRKKVQLERHAIIQKMLKAKEGGAKTQPAQGQGRRMMHCDTLDEGEHEHDHEGHSGRSCGGH